jgi:hypothetical protein
MVAAMARIALPRIARTLAVALAAAVLLAFAGQVRAAPRASSTKSSPCTKATKKLSAASARLKAVQRRAKRGKASRRNVANARKALKKAQRAKRKACSAHAKPKPAPSPGPTSPPGPPQPGSTPPVTQPDPPPPPPSETSEALIEKALKEGRIDAETALRYRVFSEFGDSRLPEEFRGTAPLGVTDTDTLDEVVEHWADLSPATREVLDPFFVPPFNPGSWDEPGSAASVAAAIRSDARSAVAEAGQPGSDLCGSTAPDMSRWGYVTAAGGEVRVWYESAQAGQQNKAISVAEYLDAGAWTKVISAFREPKPDGGDLAGKRCRGFDPSVDIVLAGLTGVSGRTLGYFDKPGCAGPIPGFVLVGRDLTGKDLMSTVVHELAHLTHYAYSTNYCRDGIPWLTEATAAWTESYVGGLGPTHPEQFAPWFFDRPNLPLETYEAVSTGTPRQYGAYLFFQWLAKNKGANAIGQVWYYTESGDHPIDTTQLALKDLGYSGGFDEAWKKFALAGLNPRAQVDWFKQWGLPTGARIGHDIVPADDAVTLPVDLPHLSARYHDLTFTDAVKGIEVENPLAGVAGASVQAWLRIDDGGTPRTEVRDLSDDEKTTFCRELPAENVQEIALVVGNSVHADRSNVLHGDVKVRGTRSCGSYDGTTTTTISYNGLTETYTAKYGMDFQWMHELPAGGTDSYFQNDVNHDVTASATWTLSGVSQSDGCTYSGSASWPPGELGFEAMLTLHDHGKGDPETKYEFGFGVPFKAYMAHRSCPDGYQGEVYYQLGHGFQSQSHPWDPTSQGMTGSETQATGGVTIKHDWNLSRKEIGPS